MILNCIWKGLTTGLLVMAVLTLLPSEWVAWMLMAGGFCFIIIGLVNAAKRQPYALLMTLCGLLLALAANVVAELVMLVSK